MSAELSRRESHSRPIIHSRQHKTAENLCWAPIDIAAATHTAEIIRDFFNVFHCMIEFMAKVFFRWITCNDMANCGRMRIIKGEMMMEKCSIRQLKKMKRSRETDIESDLTFGWRRKGLTLFAAHLSVSHVSAEKNTEIHFFFPHFFHLQRFGEKRSKKNHTNYIWSDHRTLVNSYGNFFFNFCFLLKHWMGFVRLLTTVKCDTPTNTGAKEEEFREFSTFHSAEHNCWVVNMKKNSLKTAQARNVFASRVCFNAKQAHFWDYNYMHISLLLLLERKNEIMCTFFVAFLSLQRVEHVGTGPIASLSDFTPTVPAGQQPRHIFILFNTFF